MNGLELLLSVSFDGITVGILDGSNVGTEGSTRGKFVGFVGIMVGKNDGFFVMLGNTEFSNVGDSVGEGIRVGAGVVMISEARALILVYPSRRHGKTTSKPGYVDPLTLPFHP